MFNTDNLLLSPPIALAILLAVSALFAVALKAFAIRPKQQAGGFTKPYACGEESNPMIQPDYRQFFPFAFFFTVLHVVAMMVATVPSPLVSTNMAALVVAFVYIVGAVIGLLVLYRK